MFVPKGSVIPVFIGLASISSAQLINGGFEDPALSAGTYTNTGINGWTYAVGNPLGVWHNVIGDGYWLENAPEGNQIGYTNGSSISQVSGTLWGVGENKLELYIGRRLDQLSGDLNVEWWAGGTASGGTFVGGNMVLSATFGIGGIPLGRFLGEQVTDILNSGNPNIGLPMGVRIVLVNGGQIDFDNVRLTSPVPEPASLCALGIGALALLRRRRSR